jgi:hypothetical protein
MEPEEQHQQDFQLSTVKKPIINEPMLMETRLAAHHNNYPQQPAEKNVRFTHTT